MLSLILIPFNLIMNILTIMNSVILLAILYGVYYIYTNREQIYNKIIELIGDIIEAINLPTTNIRKRRIKEILLSQLMNNYDE
mgnify:CR=1 FL=1